MLFFLVILLENGLCGSILCFSAMHVDHTLSCSYCYQMLCFSFAFLLIFVIMFFSFSSLCLFGGFE